MNVLKLLGFFIYVLIAISGLAYAGDDADKLLASLQKKYSAMQDISISFTQVSYSVVSKETLSFTGSLKVKKGNKYCIELEKQIVVTDGKTLWTYLKMENSLLVDHYKEAEQVLSPEKILTTLPGKFAAENAGKEKLGTSPTTILKLTPTEKNSPVKMMKLWIDERDLLMKKIYIHDVSNSEITYILDDVKFNAGIKDSTFIFEPTEDTEVFDLR
ncbi:MAG: outer membrane lipoprotein carrier protein LolA [Bacteroidetes bacterium]|nr:MAG: outer membrane lipoprotein carrier protein LolA [Bacteroidota bacterium]